MGNMVGSEGGEFIFELKPQALTALTPQLEGREKALNEKLSELEKQIAAKQDELLKLQASISALNGRGAAVAAPVPKQARAYDLDRTALRLYREKKYDEALAALQQAVQLKPQDATIMNNLGFLYYKLGRFEEARATLEKTLTIDPNRKEAHGNLADTYAKLGRNKDARDQYQQYLALYPSSPRAEEVKKLLASL
jgi:Tfp pilus assembly protein PilF